MNLNEALSSAKDMFTIPDEVMGNIQKAFEEVLEIAKQKLGRGEG
jgi:hypothetical protein